MGNLLGVADRDCATLRQYAENLIWQEDTQSAQDVIFPAEKF